MQANSEETQGRGSLRRVLYCAHEVRSHRLQQDFYHFHDLIYSSLHGLAVLLTYTYNQQSSLSHRSEFRRRTNIRNSLDLDRHALG